MRFPTPLLLAATALLGACSSTPTQPLATVPKVDVRRYMGHWNEVARLPMTFQNGCTQSTADYALKPDGTVSVHNRAVKGGKPTEIRGTATVVDPKTNAALEVRFNEWFSVFIPRARQGNYFVIWLAPDYSAAAVGTPDRQYLWILARERTLPTATYRQIVEHCRRQGFPVEKLIVEPGQRR